MEDKYFLKSPLHVRYCISFQPNNKIQRKNILKNEIILIVRAVLIWHENIEKVLNVNLQPKGVYIYWTSLFLKTNIVLRSCLAASSSLTMSFSRDNQSKRFNDQAHTYNEERMRITLHIDFKGSNYTSIWSNPRWLTSSIGKWSQIQTTKLLTGRLEEKKYPVNMYVFIVGQCRHGWMVTDSARCPWRAAWTGCSLSSEK